MGRVFRKPICPAGHDKRVTGYYVNGACKLCNKASSRKFVEENREYRRNYDYDYYRKCGEEGRKKRAISSRFARTGWTNSEYEQALSKQGNKCAICMQSPKNKGHNDRLHADHNHITGKSRQLLCDNCNKGLGHFRDSVKILAHAIQYLSYHDSR